MGAYHGKRTFDVFSHERAVLSKPLSPDTLRLIYPPYTPRKSRFISKSLRRLS
jgi:aldehyde dehydrogenase (NAD+)